MGTEPAFSSILEHMCAIRRGNSFEAQPQALRQRWLMPVHMHGKTRGTHLALSLEERGHLCIFVLQVYIQD